MKENITYHTRTISLAEIFSEKWLVVLYYPPLTTPACAHWHLSYQKPEFICQCCFERFSVEQVTVVIQLEDFLSQVASELFTDLYQTKQELLELQRKIQENQWNRSNTETE